MRLSRLQPQERHPTDLAGLRSARLVTAIETEEGRRWAESRIKSLTGGDGCGAVHAAGLFEFTPQFKLVIAGNHKPGLRSVDEAIRRRFNLIPFTVQIPPEERDDTLTEKLKSEWPGILSWMIEGCLDWQRDGLAAPTAVRDATAQYLASEDAIASWMDDKCERGPQTRETSTDLFISWKNWADAAGEPHGTQRRFSEKLEDRGSEGGRVATEDHFRDCASGFGKQQISIVVTLVTLTRITTVRARVTPISRRSVTERPLRKGILADESAQTTSSPCLAARQKREPIRAAHRLKTRIVRNALGRYC